MYRILFSVLIFFFTSSLAFAHEPVLVHPTDVDDVYAITDPIRSQAFYGTLNNFPHTYEIRAEKAFTLFAEILVPDIDSSTNNISGVIIKEEGNTGRVSDVAVFDAKQAVWNVEYEPFGGDSYRHGPQFEKELEPGVYRIEVHTPDNQEKYVLVVGTKEEQTIGYFELIRRIAGVKVFFEKSQLRIVESPFVYVPLIGFILAILFFRSVRNRRRAV